MFAIQCRGEAFAVIGINTSMPKRANASPLLQTNLLNEKKQLIIHI
jgi:hypothetical protein